MLQPANQTCLCSSNLQISPNVLKDMATREEETVVCVCVCVHVCVCLWPSAKLVCVPSQDTFWNMFCFVNKSDETQEKKQKNESKGRHKGWQMANVHVAIRHFIARVSPVINVCVMTANHNLLLLRLYHSPYFSRTVECKQHGWCVCVCV